MPRFCSGCGHALDPSTRFCPGCGRQVDQDSGGPVIAAAPAAATSIRRRGGPSRLVVGLLAVVLIAVGVVGISFLITAGPADAVAAHLSALARADDAAAYSYTSASFRQVTAPDAFRRFVDANPILRGSASITDRAVEGDTATVTAELTAPDGTKRVADFQLVKEAGDWKISGSRLRAAGTGGTPAATAASTAAATAAACGYPDTQNRRLAGGTALYWRCLERSGATFLSVQIVDPRADYPLNAPEPFAQTGGNTRRLYCMGYRMKGASKPADYCSAMTDYARSTRSEGEAAFARDQATWLFTYVPESIFGEMGLRVGTKVEDIEAIYVYPYAWLPNGQGEPGNAVPGKYQPRKVITLNW